MRVKTHRRADHIGHLMETPVVHIPQRVEHPTLHGLQPIIDMRNRTIENHVARILEIPLTVMPL